MKLKNAIAVVVMGLALTGCGPFFFPPPRIGSLVPLPNTLTFENGQYVAHLRACTPEDIYITQVTEDRGIPSRNGYDAVPITYSKPEEIKKLLGRNNLLFERGCIDLYVHLEGAKSGYQETIFLQGITREGKGKELNPWSFIVYIPPKRS